MSSIDDRTENYCRTYLDLETVKDTTVLNQSIYTTGTEEYIIIDQPIEKLLDCQIKHLENQNQYIHNKINRLLEEK